MKTPARLYLAGELSYATGSSRDLVNCSQIATTNPIQGKVTSAPIQGRMPLDLACPIPMITNATIIPMVAPTVKITSTVPLINPSA